MKKYGIMLVFIWIVFLIQVNLFPSLNLVTTTPNLLIIIVVGYSLTCGSLEGLIAGILSGMILDVFSGHVLCYYALPYMYIGYFTGIFKKYLNTDSFVIPGLFCGCGDFIIGLYVFVFSFAMRNRLNLSFYLKTIILPEVLYTVILSLIVFPVFVRLDKVFRSWIDRRGRNRID